MTGTTTKADLAQDYHDKTLTECHADGITYNVVRVEDDENGVAGTAFPICEGHYFEIVIYARLVGGVYRPWRIGSINGSTDLDIIGLLTHEFGHVQNIGHPANSGLPPSQQVYAVMHSQIFSGTNMQRNLYQWDYECSEEFSGKRDLTGWRQQQASNGSFGTVQNDSVSNASKGDISWVWTGPIGIPHYMYLTDTCGIYSKSQAGTGICIENETRHGVAPLAALFDEDTSREFRVYYPSYEDTGTAYNILATHYVLERRQDDSFANASTLRYCTGIVNWYGACTAEGYVQTGHRMAKVYNKSIKRTHLAWVNQNRLTDSETNEIWISTGELRSPPHIAPPRQTGIQSRVSPGIACDSDNNCMVAYVDQKETLNRVRIRTFSAVATSTHYDLIVDSTQYTLPVDAQTASSIAAWYHDATDRYYVAYRSHQWNQPTEVYYSTDLLSWTQSTDSFPDSAVGPFYSDDTDSLITWN